MLLVGQVRPRLHSAVLSLLIAGLIPQAASAECKPSGLVPETFLQRFNQEYAENYAEFFRTLSAAKAAALQCSSVCETAAFLDLVRFSRGNAELTEFFGQAVETLAMSRTECLLDTWGLLSITSRSLLVTMLQRPLFTDEVEIAGILKPYRTTAKYRSFFVAFDQTDASSMEDESPALPASSAEGRHRE